MSFIEPRFTPADSFEIGVMEIEMPLTLPCGGS
jgi:hypothetical protein